VIKKFPKKIYKMDETTKSPWEQMTNCSCTPSNICSTTTTRGGRRKEE
jgi:hypothetical protein